MGRLKPILPMLPMLPMLPALLLLLALGGCRDPAKSIIAGPPTRTFHLRGRIVAADASTATVAAGAVPGLMEAMTMPYKLADPTVAAELHPGDVITADVLAEEDAAGPRNLRLDHIVVVGQRAPDYLPARQYHVPKAGEAIPDFALLNQSGKTIHLAEFRGRVLLLTFIYTRCPLAEFCPRMSSQFAEIDKELEANKKLYRTTHLLSVSFDPAYDTPTVLRSYGGAHTGRFTDEDFAHWDFAAPPIAELSRMEQFFNVGVTGSSADPSSIQHSLSTVLVGRDGKIIAWYPNNDWKPADVLAEVERAAR